MNANHSENQSWIVKAGGDAVKKRARAGHAALSPKEKLLYCLWIADYGMCNAGDLSQAHILYADWQREAVQMAGDLGLEFTRESFSLPKATLQAQYFERFERICNEVRQA